MYLLYPVKCPLLNDINQSFTNWIAWGIIEKNYIFKEIPWSDGAMLRRRYYVSPAEVSFVIDWLKTKYFQLWRMRWKCWVSTFSEIPWKECVILRRRYFAFPEKFFSLLTVRNGTYQTWRICSTWFFYSLREITWTERVMLRRRYLVQPVKCPRYGPISTKFLSIVAYLQYVIYLYFQRDYFNRTRGAAKTVLCTSSKVP
jgi:hypothetical protein